MSRIALREATGRKTRQKIGSILCAWLRSHMCVCVNNEIDNDDEWAKGGPYPRNKVDVKAKAKFAKEQICSNKVGPFLRARTYQFHTHPFWLCHRFSHKSHSRPSKKNPIPNLPFFLEAKVSNKFFALKTPSPFSSF